MCLFSWHFHNILNVCTTSGPEKLHWKPTGYLLLILFGANWIWLNSMPKHRCAWGTCNSDGRYKDRPHMQGVTFHTFARPHPSDDNHPDSIKCREWIRACGRPFHQLNLDVIRRDKAKKNYYYRICSKVRSNESSTQWLLGSAQWLQMAWYQIGSARPSATKMQLSLVGGCHSGTILHGACTAITCLIGPRFAKFNQFYY